MVFHLNPSIIIVGSGLSGIAAATKLLKNNFTNVKILEAENRIGGRIHSIKYGDAYVDLGAELCHGQEGNIVYSMVKDLGILKPSTEKVNFVVSNGNLVREEISDKILTFTATLTATEEYGENYCHNLTSVGECLTIESQKFVATVQDPKEKEILTLTPEWLNLYLSGLKSAFNSNDLKLTTDYKSCEGDQYLNWNGLGYKTILDVMMQKYPATENQLPIDDKIFLQKEVHNIYNWQNGDKVAVNTSDGNTYKADHLIFTPSVGVLKANYQTLFNPALPQEKVEAIKNIGFGAVMKVIMHFSDRWWKDDTFWSFLWTTEDKQNLKQVNLEWLNSIEGISQGQNNPNVLIAWYVGGNIPLMETLSDEQILEGQKYLINTFLASQFNITTPDKIIRTSWYSNPHFRGTSSYESVKGHSTGGSKFPDKLAQPLFNHHNYPKVLFAGEATHPYYFSTVHGAIETGYREADRLIHLYQK